MIARLDLPVLRVVIAHELVHHRRRDLPIAWMAAAATSLFWFTPIAWRLARTLRELREECCDAAVIGIGVATPATYAAALLAAAAVPPTPGALAMRDGHPLGRRLRRVLDEPRPLPPLAAALLLTLFPLLCLPSTPFASLWPSGDDDREVRVIRIVR
jgi:beta-lactamase regulating signal transducer with metallopeptidase domain